MVASPYLQGPASRWEGHSAAWSAGQYPNVCLQDHALQAQAVRAGIAACPDVGGPADQVGGPEQPWQQHLEAHCQNVEDGQADCCLYPEHTWGLRPALQGPEKGDGQGQPVLASVEVESGDDAHDQEVVGFVEHAC